MSRFIYLVFFIIFLDGCGSDSSLVRSYKGYKIFLLNLFKTSYLWSEDINTDIELSKIDSPYQMVEMLKYRPKDRWSFVLSKEENSKLFSSNAKGFGFAYTLIDGNFTILYTLIDSPADKAGLKRGDIVVSIDGHRPLDLNFQELLNENRDIEFKVFRRGEYKLIDIRPSEFYFKFTKREIIDGDIGYLRLDLFSPDAIEEIDEAFFFFKSHNIRDLVVDIRYNSGGSVVVASVFLDKLVSNLDGEVQFRLKWNEKYKKRDYIYRFEHDENSLNLERIIFLTTKITASASEIVINSLKPYIDVITIGDRTYGKPVGMEGVSDRFYVYYLINFKIENSVGFSDYFDGLDVTCKSLDDLSHTLGDINETMLRDALFFMENGECRRY